MKKHLVLLTFFMIFGLMLFGQTNNHWTTDITIYPNNMAITAKVFIDDVEQLSTNVEVAAFCNNEVRGNIRLKYESEDMYLLYLTVYGNDGDIINFKTYNHETQTEFEMPSNETITFVTNGNYGTLLNPYEITFTSSSISTFTGNGSWNDASNWGDYSVPTETNDVIIDGNVVITEGNIIINSLTINDNKSLTIQDGGTLTVNETITNTDVDALIIEEGGQIFQTNDNVAATFRNEIVVPTGIWGEEDETGWQFISSPIANVNTNDFIPESGDYDLYIYDGTNEYQWQNFKQMGTLSYDFSSNPFNNGWTLIDADGDGLNWEYDDRDGFMTSYSYYDREDIYADNYLISPQIMVNNSTILSFNAYVTYDRTPETFKVLLSTSNNSVDYFTEVLGDGEYSIDNEDAINFTIDLSEYAGNNVYIAFYHYLADDARSGSEQLIIDDVEFVNENSFEKGRGYLVSYENEDNVAEFKGNLNYLAEGESFQINLNHYQDNNLAQFHLIGNPFPFNVNWDTDINVNNVYNGFATLDATNGGYVYKEESETIKSGEGFMVKTMEGNENYVAISKGVSKSYRKGNNSINITASNTKGSDNVIIKFNDEKQSGFPKLANFNDKIANVYVKDEDVNYGIYNYNHDINEIPLYFDAKEMGNYTLTFDVKGNYEYLYLIDKMTGEKVNLLLENEYMFMANSNDNNDRFIISFANSQQPIANGNFAYLFGKELIINAEGTIQIIDMMGRVVMTNDNHNGRINISDLNNAAYLIRCINENGVKVQKIVL